MTTKQTVYTKMPLSVFQHSMVKIGSKEKAGIYDIDYILKYGVKQSYSTDKLWLPSIQNTNCGYRVGNKDPEYFSKKWDGYIFVDVDHLVDDPDAYLQYMHKNLCKYKFYKCSQLSFSKKGFHLIFFIRKQHGTVEEYYTYAAYIYSLIFDKLIPIENYDWHNFQHHQLIKLTADKWYVNENFVDETLDVDEEQILPIFKQARKHFVELYYQNYDDIVDKKPKLDRQRYNYSQISDRTDDKPFFYFEHTDRWKLFMTLMYIYDEDEDMVYDTACKIMKYSYTDKHTYEELCSMYSREKTNKDWFKKYEESKKKDFNYEWFINWLETNFDIKLIDHNRHNIQLKDDEYLYDKNDLILKYLKPGINFLVVRTGGGKTTIWDKLRLKSITIEPYNSVATDKFDNVYKAVGAGNPIDTSLDYQITNHYRFIDFVNRENKFYEYIIVDESHIIGTQSFRNIGKNSRYGGHTMIDFIRCLNDYSIQYPESKIILQTATPSNEESLFNINNFITVDKNSDKKVQIHYQKFMINADEDEKYNIKYNIVKKVEEFHQEGRKVYIYFGSGGLRFMKAMRSLVNLLKGYKVAIYHKQNEGADDIENIRANKKIGEYDALISSCYFSVGCDLNDEEDAGIIIIGNNTYQEDEQVIGRFRKSKNIKVSILVDEITNIKKVDVSDLLAKERRGIYASNEIHKIRNNTLMNSICDDESVDLYAYIKCSDMYFEDLERKFDWYNSQGYEVVNILKKEYRDDNWVYDICEDVYGCTGEDCDVMLPVIYNLDIDEELYKSLDKVYYKKEEEFQNELYEEIVDKVNNKIEIDWNDMINRTKGRPKMQDWVLMLKILDTYYDLGHVLEHSKEVTIKGITKKKCQTLLKYVMKLKNEEYDQVEHILIANLIRMYDSSKEVKREIEIWLILYYCIWVSNHTDIKEFEYDMNKSVYTIYNKWRKMMLEILNVHKSIRNYIIEENTNKAFFDYTDSSISDFLKNVFEKKTTEEQISYYLNGAVFNNDIKRFIKTKLSKFDAIKTKDLLKNEINEIDVHIGHCRRKIEIDGKTYDSVTQAAEDLGISRQALYKRLKTVS